MVSSHVEQMPCFLAQWHPYIPLHFEEMIFFIMQCSNGTVLNGTFSLDFIHPQELCSTRRWNHMPSSCQGRRQQHMVCM